MKRVSVPVILYLQITVYLVSENIENFVCSFVNQINIKYGFLFNPIEMFYVLRSIKVKNNNDKYKFQSILCTVIINYTVSLP